MTDISPVQVHVVADTSDRPAPAARRRRTTYQTVTLIATDSAQPILPATDRVRLHAIVCALDGNVTLSSRLSDAAAGVGTILPQGMPWPLVDDGAVFAGASGLTGTTTSRVSVSAVYED